ncbi:MAG: CDP-glycerol glycerophosphotransferase family protein [Gammaproteobacteria bacterium]
MGAFSAWRSYRKLPPEWRRIVFYSESGQDWHHFEPLIDELNGPLERRVTYVTSDPGDPGLLRRHERFRALCIPEGWFLTIHFQFQKAGVVVLTMMDLGTLQLKRSINPVHYVYLFHSMGSTHMVDHANSYDAYDSLFCVGPHHVRELRRREELAGLAPRQLFEFGHPRLEALVAEAAARPPARNDAPVVLVAPTWGEDSIFNRCGDALLATLLDAGYHVIMRPHYHTRRLTPGVLDALIERFSGHERFEVVERMGEMDTLFRSDLLVCDWSAMAIEYALGLEKPVLFIDLPRRIRNPDWQALGIEPFESAIREQVGEILSPDRLDEAPAAIERLLASPEAFAGRMRALREEAVFNPGRSVALGAREIARLADARASAEGKGDG